MVFSGGEGSGKSTQAKSLHDYFLNSGRQTLLTKEPGGDDGVCRDIRQILLNSDYKGGHFDNIAELLLFKADRAQHSSQIILPALQSGHDVISDRFNADTYAYQVGGRGVINDKQFLFLDELVVSKELRPDFYIYVDIDPKEGLARKKNDGVETRFEKEDLEFHQRVRQGFLRFFNEFVEKDRWQMFDGLLPVQQLHQQIVAILKEKRLI